MSSTFKLPHLQPTGGNNKNGSHEVYTSRRHQHCPRHIYSSLFCDMTKTRYLMTPRESKHALHSSSSKIDTARLVSDQDLKRIERHITHNQKLQPKHRREKISDLIPVCPFAPVRGPSDTILLLSLAKVNDKESALDVPLRLAIPTSLHVPGIVDPPTVVAGVNGAMQMSLAMRLVKLLKGTSHVPQHWPTDGGAEDCGAVGVDVLTCGAAHVPKDFAKAHQIVRDWEMKRDMARRKHHIEVFAQAALALGSLHYNASNREQALLYFAEAAAAFRECDKRGAALCLNLVGVTLMHLGRYEEALPKHQQFLLSSKQSWLGTELGAYCRAVAHSNRAVCYAALGDFSKSFEASRAASDLATECGDPVLETIALGNAGIGAMRTGHYSDAQQYMERCLERCSMSGDKVGAAVCLIFLGNVFLLRKDLQHAHFYFDNALRLAREMKCQDLIYVATLSIGVSKGTQKQNVVSSMVIQRESQAMLSNSISHPIESPPSSNPDYDVRNILANLPVE